MITGILPVDKPLGWTSHDVVARVRRVAGQRQVGHAGTLDPLATGVLLLVLGRATRLSSYLMGSAKEYCAEVVLGAGTATDDAEAPLLLRSHVAHLDRPAVEAALARFVGEIDQVPPRYAAVRQGGEKLYVLARRGEDVTPRPRRVKIDAITVERWNPPRLRLRVRCEAGTYIRSLARDIGGALEVGGYLHGLRRTASGSFTSLDCVRLEHLQDREAVVRTVVAPDRAVIDWPALVLDVEQEASIRVGRPVMTHAHVDGSIRLYGLSGALIALGEGVGPMIKPFRVFDAADH